jgi:hypothetical protein
MLTLSNLMGDPAYRFTMALKGSSEVGMQVEKGWISQPGMLADLKFVPEIQREVLFR